METKIKIEKENEIVKDKELFELFMFILRAESPVNVEGIIEDLAQFTEVFQDGEYSDSGFKIFINPETGVLLEYDWSNWQPKNERYRFVSLDYYMNRLINCGEGTHFDRYVEGLRKIADCLKLKGD